MDEIIRYFSTIPPLHRTLILAGGIAFFWMLESVVPFKKMDYHKWRHAGINLFFTLTTMIVNFCMALILLGAVQWTSDNHFGILYWIPKMNIWVFTVTGLLLLDFVGGYLIHYIEHKTGFLWRFHLIHHTDTWVDTTSANRHHPGESVLRFVFTIIGVLIVGTPLWLVFMYQTLSVIIAQLNHANIILPEKAGKLLSYFIVTPDMHKVHHHYMLPYTDSNYGNIFSFWDRLFGTFRILERKKIIYGVDTHMQPHENNRLLNLLLIPFQKKRTSKS